MATTETTTTTLPRETASSEPSDGRFDDVRPSDYDPGLYRRHGLAESITGFDAVDDAQIARFHEQGFLAIERAFSPQEVRDALDGMLDVIDGKYPGYRGLQFEAGARALLPTTPREQKQDLIRKLEAFVRHDTRLHAIATDRRLLNLVERLIGDRPGILSDKALIKPPRIGREKPWHQDHAYFNVDLRAKTLTAWIALDPATEENGCLYVIPGSHREGAVVHFSRRDWQICDEHVQTERVVAAPLAPGGVLLFDSYLHHGTPANSSPQRRRALQFVYIPATAGRITPAERLAVFGSEGKDVEC
jgi:phytanoyl-CoA hydroxylase